jgi:DNA-binding FadR family transcriptional regulator
MRRERLAAQVARLLEDQLLDGQWPVGHYIGREAALATEMGVSRWTLREAVRILEAAGFVAARKGVGGGLFVASSAHDFVCKTVSNYLEFVQVSLDEFMDVHRALGHLAITHALEALPADERRTIEIHLEKTRDRSIADQLVSVGEIHHALVRAAGNPALVLFSGALTTISADASIYSDLDDAKWHVTFGTLVGAIGDMARAVLELRADAAHDAHDVLVRAFGALLEGSLFYRHKPISNRSTARAYDFFPPARPSKKVDTVERGIREMIIEADWPVGANLGSEKELAERFQVGRWVLREALRSLEQLGVVEMGRGSRSGLRVVSPDPGVVAEACRRQLRREGLRRAQAAPILSTLRDLAKGRSAPLPINDLLRRALADWS